MSKFKGKYIPYSPSQNMRDLSSDTLPSGEPHSPMSSNSLIFNGEHWELPIDEEDLNFTNFQPRNCSSPQLMGK